MNVRLLYRADEATKRQFVMDGRLVAADLGVEFSARRRRGRRDFLIPGQSGMEAFSMWRRRQQRRGEHECDTNDKSPHSASPCSLLTTRRAIVGADGEVVKEKLGKLFGLRLGLAPLPDGLVLMALALLKMSPVDRRILQDAFRDLKMRGVFERNSTESSVVEREDLGAGKSQQNWRMSRDDELRLAGCHQRGHVRQQR